MIDRSEFYLCPNCLNPASQGGDCQICGASMLHCRPGEPDDPCRRPLIDSQGQVRTRAPLWWLKHHIPDLTRYYENE